MAHSGLNKVTVEPFMFLSMFVAFLTWVAFPQMILNNICLRTHNKTRCAAMFTGSYKKDYDIVQKESTLWFGGFLGIATFIAILTLPLVGTLSDRFGRYKIMFLAPIGQLLQAITMVGILYHGLDYPTWALLLPGFMPGMVGDVSGLYVLAASYITDITSEEARTLRITLVDSVVLLASLSSTLCSGFIIEAYGYFGIFVTNIISLVLALSYLIFWVKPVTHKKEGSSEQTNIEDQEVNPHVDKNEGKPSMTGVRGTVTVGDEMGQTVKADEPAEQREDCSANTNDMTCARGSCYNNQPLPIIEGVDINKSNDKLWVPEHDGSMPNVKEAMLQPPVELISQEGEKMPACSQVLQILKQSNPLRNLKRVYGVLKADGQMFRGMTLFLLMFLAAVCYSGEMSVLALYLKNRPYFFSPRDLGFYFAYVSGIIAILGLAFFNYLFTKRIKLNDYLILLMSFCFFTVYYTLLSVANSILMLYLIQLVHCIGSLNTCIIRSLLSKLTPESTTGLLFGALFMAETIGVMFGSLICPAVYSLVAATYPGAVFFVNAGLSSVSVITTIVLMVKVRNTSQNSRSKDIGNLVGDEQ